MIFMSSLLTSPSLVLSSHPFTSLANCSVAIPSRAAVMTGVLMLWEALMISLIRGTPWVMFMAATPAKWNVFSVICVPGSPILWAAMAPTGVPEPVSVYQFVLILTKLLLSPGSIVALWNLSTQVCMNLFSWECVILSTSNNTIATNITNQI